jgi:DnaJ-class molecular chaperone
LLQIWQFFKIGYPISSHDIFKSFFGTYNPFSCFEFGDDSEYLFKKDVVKKIDDATYNISCSIKELYLGCIKKYTIVRKLQITKDDDIIDESKTFSINVKPGWKNGTKVLFSKEGSHTL